MMEIKIAMLWWIVNDDPEHEPTTIRDMMPIVEALFPGINYYSTTGFIGVMRSCVAPALRKLFPELLTTPRGAVDPGATTEIVKVLPSDGYEWQDSTEWRSKFEKFLATA